MNSMVLNHRSYKKGYLEATITRLTKLHKYLGLKLSVLQPTPMLYSIYLYRIINYHLHFIAFFSNPVFSFKM